MGGTFAQSPVGRRALLPGHRYPHAARSPSGASPMTEADTCRKFVVPLLQKAGWDNDPHSIAEQRYFTPGRIVAQGQTARRRPGKRADYLLRYTRDLPLAVVEAKADYKTPGRRSPAGQGVRRHPGPPIRLRHQRARASSSSTSSPATSANSPTIQPRRTCGPLPPRPELTTLPPPTAFSHPSTSPPARIPHYYQRIAIDRAIQAILSGKRRVLVTMATGTGKTGSPSKSAGSSGPPKWNAH